MKKVDNFQNDEYCCENRCVATPFCRLRYLQSIFSLSSVDLNIREKTKREIVSKKNFVLLI